MQQDENSAPFAMNTAAKTLNKIVYEQLFKIVDPKLKNYKTDLTKHDFNQILNLKPGAEFIHITRESGTQFFNLNFISQENKNALDFLITLFNFRLENGCKLILFYNGQDLKKITPERARKIFFPLIEKRQQQIKRELETINN